LLDGSRRQGEIRFRDDKFTFLPAGQAAPLPWQQLDRVESRPLPAPVPALPFSWHAMLANGDHFACNLLDIESNAMVVDTSWFQGLRVRRTAIRSLERPQGWATWLRQDFAREARGWKQLREGNDSLPIVGVGGLELGQAVRRLEFTPEAPSTFGRISLRLRDSLTPGVVWRLQLGIDGDQSFQALEVKFGGSTPCELQSPGQKILHQDVRTGPAILIQLEISPSSLRVVVDGRLASWVERGFVDARLRSISLKPEAPAEANSHASLVLQEFAIARRFEPLPRPPAHAEQDEVWLESGDQLFGSLRTLDARFVELATPQAPRRIPGSQIRGLYPKPAVVRDVLTPAPWRLVMLDPADPEPGRLSGAVRAWGEREVVLIHPLLGELKIPRGQVKAVAQAESASAGIEPGFKRVIKP
jgi:hypothetical protein